MALKRSRTSSSYDANKFVSVAASNRYETSLLKKVPIGERGSTYQRESSTISIRDSIEEDGENSANNHLLHPSLGA